MYNKELLKNRPIGEIDEEQVKKIAEVLNQLLANEFALFTKTLNFHWNVTGPRFHSIHTFLENHYNTLLTVMDDIAERVRMIGEIPLGTVSEMNSKMEIKEAKTNKLSENQMMQELFRGHLCIQNEIKLDIAENKSAFEKDLGSEDFLIGILRSHEKMSWMIKSHLE